MRKKRTYLFSVVFSFLALSGNAQDSKKIYRTHSVYFSNEGEMIFSFANIDSDSIDFENILRWSPVFNFTRHLNYDLSRYVGLNVGLGIHNVGFIAKLPSAPDGLKKKYRTYNLGLPLGLKIGDLNQRDPFFFFGGYEIEMPIHYKEKTFHNGDKDNKISGWFSERTERFAQSLYVGIQFPQGFALKFKYYLNNFLNEDFALTKDGITLHPYAGFTANVFYFSINWFPFQDTKLRNLPIGNPDGTVVAAKW